MPLSSPATFTTTLHWLLAHGYAVMFIAMIFEGPLVIMAASFAASMGYFNASIVFALAVLGDVTGDMLWYTAGYFGRIAWLRRFGNRFAGSGERIRKVGRIIERHPGKTLIAIKLSPFTPVPGLFAVGASHLSPTKFAAIISLIIIPKTAVFVVLGYFFGHAYDAMASYMEGPTYAFLIVLVLALGSYFGYRKIADRLSKKLEVQAGSSPTECVRRQQ